MKYDLPLLTQYYKDKERTKVLKQLGTDGLVIKSLGLPLFNLPKLNSILAKAKNGFTVSEIANDYKIKDKKLMIEYLQYLVLSTKKIMWLNELSNPYNTIGLVDDNYWE